MFFWNSRAFTMIQWLLAIWPIWPEVSLSIWKFSVHVLLKPSLENFDHYFASIWDECNCAVVWAFFGIAFLWGWNENWPFPVLRPLLSFPNLLAYFVQYFPASSFRIFNSSAGIPSPPLALFIIMLPTAQIWTKNGNKKIIALTFRSSRSPHHIPAAWSRQINCVTPKSTDEISSRYKILVH